VDIAIRTEHLTKIYAGRVIAVNDLDLEVPRGAVYGLWAEWSGQDHDAAHCCWPAEADRRTGECWAAVAGRTRPTSDG